MIPIFWFGHVIGSRLKREGEEVCEEFYIERYTWSNVGGDITIIPRIDRLQMILYQMLLFFGGALRGGNAKHIQQVRYDLDALKIYLDGGYDLESTSLSPYYRGMIRIYEKVIPRDEYFASRSE